MVIKAIHIGTADGLLSRDDEFDGEAHRTRCCGKGEEMICFCTIFVSRIGVEFIAKSRRQQSRQTSANGATTKHTKSGIIKSSVLNKTKYSRMSTVGCHSTSSIQARARLLQQYTPSTYLVARLIRGPQLQASSLPPAVFALRNREEAIFRLTSSAYSPRCSEYFWPYKPVTLCAREACPRNTPGTLHPVR